jgi:L-asparagine transporter-like permease
MQPSKFKFINIKPHCCQSYKIILRNYAILNYFRKSKFLGPCRKPRFLTILISWISLYSCQKDERTKAANLQTKRFSFTLPAVQCPSPALLFFLLATLAAVSEPNEQVFYIIPFAFSAYRNQWKSFMVNPVLMMHSRYTDDCSNNA